jgi:L-lactate dehydrogenase (cytochrome)
MKDRDFMNRLILRAREAKCSALMVTLDLQVMGQRHNDIRNYLSAPPKINLNTIQQFLTKPRWCLNMLTTSKHSFGNIMGHVNNVTNLSSLASWTADQFDPSLSWADISWIRERWPGKLILKGIMDKEDAKLALQTGAEAIIVSNHGGRQLDGAPSTISVLADIVDTVGDYIEVHFDGGIRSGQDVLKALSVGAHGTYIGRPYVYGLAASGQSGVMNSIEIIRKELDLSMAMCGEKNINDVGRHNLAKIPFDYGNYLNLI